MAKYFLEYCTKKENEEKSLRGSILELGSGTALPSIIAAKMKYFTVTTELGTYLEFTKKNMKLNLS